jgi:CheY-like chemotaxis protein
LVDDEKDTTYTFDLYLKSLGFSTKPFVNPVEALDYFNKNFTNCILVITDYAMLQMSGINLIQKIRKKDQNFKIKIIVISATVKDDIIKHNDKLFNLKIDKFLEKPIPLYKLKN